eukprot:356312-Chlamydomonas_euryale.AAC.7
MRRDRRGGRLPPEPTCSSALPASRAPPAAGAAAKASEAPRGSLPWGGSPARRATLLSAGGPAAAVEAPGTPARRSPPGAAAAAAAGVLALATAAAAAPPPRGPAFDSSRAAGVASRGACALETLSTVLPAAADADGAAAVPPVAAPSTASAFAMAPFTIADQPESFRGTALDARCCCCSAAAATAERRR